MGWIAKIAAMALVVICGGACGTEPVDGDAPEERAERPTLDAGVLRERVTPEAPNPPGAEPTTARESTGEAKEPVTTATCYVAFKVAMYACNAYPATLGTCMILARAALGKCLANADDNMS